MADIGIGEIVESQSGYHIQPFCRIPVELSESIHCMHGIISIVRELVGHQIITQVIGTDGQSMLVIESIIIECVRVMLNIAIITHIVFIKYLVVTLVILVESITDFKVTQCIKGIVGFQSTAEISISVLSISRLIPFAEIISGSCSQSETFQRMVNQPLLEVPYLASEYSGEISCVVHIVGIYIVVLYIRQTAELAGFKSYAAAISLVVVLGKA